MKQKHIAIVVLVVALLGASVYAMSNSKKSIEKPPIQANTVKPSTSTIATVDTSDWLTYRGEKYEIKYPKEAEVFADNDNTGLGVRLERYFSVPADLARERKQRQDGGVLTLGVGFNGDNPKVEFSGDNPRTHYTSPCVWYYAERENLNVESYDPAICDPSKPYVSDSDYARGYFTTFAGEPAYVRILNTLGTNGGLYAVKSYNIVFFHNRVPWEVSYTSVPDHPTDKWKAHPYYPYLEKALPISEAIVNSFHFLDATSTVRN